MSYYWSAFFLLMLANILTVRASAAQQVCRAPSLQQQVNYFDRLAGIESISPENAACDWMKLGKKPRPGSIDIGQIRSVPLKVMDVNGKETSKKFSYAVHPSIENKSSSRKTVIYLGGGPG